MNTLSQTVENSPENKFLSLLRSRNFRLFWLGEAVSVLGDHFYMVALPWLVLVAVWAACSLEPSGERPGLALPGPVVRDPVPDWSFTDAIEEIFIETKTRYGLAHSVTIWCVSIEGELYVGASAPEFPRERRWVRNVRRDPDVRLSIGGLVYERRLELITDPAETDRVNRVFGDKYHYDVDEDPDPVVYWRVVERS